MLAVASDRAMDVAGIADGKGFVVDSQPLGDAGPEFLDHYVAALMQAQKDLLAGGRFEIEPERLLVAPQRVERGALKAALGAPAHAGGAGLLGAPPRGRTGLLDFDHVGAEVAEDHRAVWSRRQPGQIENLNTAERPLIGHLITSISQTACLL